MCCQFFVFCSGNQRSLFNEVSSGITFLSYRNRLCSLEQSDSKSSFQKWALKSEIQFQNRNWDFQQSKEWQIPVARIILLAVTVSFQKCLLASVQELRFETGEPLCSLEQSDSRNSFQKFNFRTCWDLQPFEGISQSEKGFNWMNCFQIHIRSQQF